MYYLFNPNCPLILHHGQQFTTKDANIFDYHMNGPWLELFLYLTKKLHCSLAAQVKYVGLPNLSLYLLIMVPPIQI